jgi:hypothetical protein
MRQGSQNRIEHEIQILAGVFRQEPQQEVTVIL